MREYEGVRLCTHKLLFVFFSKKLNLSRSLLQLHSSKITQSYLPEMCVVMKACELATVHHLDIDVDFVQKSALQK